MLGDLELSLVQELETGETQILVDHPVPGVAGDFTQSLNRGASQVLLRGVIVGDVAKDQAEQLRRRFHDATPMAFAADVMNASRIQQVVIADLQVEELAGKPERFEYRLVLQEYIEPPPDETGARQAVDDDARQTAAQGAQQAAQQVGEDEATLEVRVDLEDDSVDLASVRVLVQGATADGTPFSETIEQPDDDNVFRRRNMPAGSYRAVAYKVQPTHNA